MGCDFAEIRGAAETQAARIAELDVVENVRDLEAEGCADASFFPDADVLERRSIDIPGRLAAKVADNRRNWCRSRECKGRNSE